MIHSFIHSFVSQVAFLLLTFILDYKYCLGNVIRNQGVGDGVKFSPYFAAFSDQLKREMVEYERLKQQLMSFHAIDWNYVEEVHGFDSTQSS